MIHTTKSRYKPKYKKLKNLKLHGVKVNTILKLKKKKWEYVKNYVLKRTGNNKKNCLYSFYDQNSYNVSKFTNRFSGNYKQKLLIKQNFKVIYGGLLDKFLKKSVRQSNTFFGSKKLIFLNNLEKRLDVTLVKSHFVSSLRTARQVINHKNVLVNGCVKTKKSFLLKKGDKISFKESIKRSINHNLICSNMWPIPPKYLEIDYKTMHITIIDNITFLNNYNLNVNYNSVFEIYKNK